MSTAIGKPKRNGNEMSPSASTFHATYMPQFDIRETDDELVMYGDMPGVGPEDLDIRFENGELTIFGKVPPRYENVEFLYSEYGVGNYHRVFAIGETIDVEKISAEMSHGVLIVHLPKSEKAKPRRIEVRAD